MLNDLVSHTIPKRSRLRRCLHLTVATCQDRRVGEQHDDWETQIAQVWTTAGERSKDAVVVAVTELARQRPAGDAAALFEQHRPARLTRHAPPSL